MNRLERTLHHVSNLLVGLTGVVYAVMRYLLEPAEPWAVVNHPWQPHVQHLHVLVAPLLVFAVGLSFQKHILPRLRNGKLARYMSGLSLFVALLPMVFSGYLIQVSVDEAWRKVWVVVHLVSSGLWLVGYVVHQLDALGVAQRVLRPAGARPALEPSYPKGDRR